MCVRACVCRCVCLLVLSPYKHEQTVIANCLGLCQESWWQQKRKMDGPLRQHSSLILRLLSRSLCLCLCFSICSLPPALCLSSLPVAALLYFFPNSSIPSTSLSSSDPLASLLSSLFVSELPALMPSILCCLGYLSLSLSLFLSLSVCFLLTGLAGLLRTGLACCILCVCVCVCGFWVSASIRAHVSVW